MNNYKNKISILATFIVLLSFGNNVAAKTIINPAPKKITKEFVRIFYCQNGKKASDSLAKNYRSVDIIAPQAYSITATGTLIGGVDPKITAIATKRKIKIMPLIVNKGFSSRAAADFFDDIEHQQSAVNAMVDEGIKNSYWGWQVDFEQVNISYQKQFSDFVAILGDALHKNGMTVSVAVIAQTSTEPTDYKGDYWNKFIGVYDYAALASSSDFISLMSYDDPGSTGPATRYTWLKQVLNFSLKYIPPEKISIGIPLYYWRWNDSTGKRVGTGTYTQLLQKMNQYNMKRGYDPKEAASYMRYRSNKMTYTIWYENSKSVAKKIDLIKENGLHGFSAWALGQEVPNFHEAIFSNKYLVDRSLVMR
ncbi:MAG: glycosyl hydrolase family 18 protein [Patescibacteria group bacterium]|jgi:spore germination protein YaaH